VSAQVLVFGGTFDPVHVGHVAVADQAAQSIHADEVWFMPSRIPPLHEAPVADVNARLALLRAALEPYAHFRVSDDDLLRDGPSYTLDTMKLLRARHPQASLSLLVGADAARSIARWYHADELLAGERFVIVNRSGTPALDMHDAQRLGFAPSRTTLVAVESPPVSASEVRRRVAAGESLAGLVAPEVAVLIDRMGLYRGDARDMHNGGG